MSGLLCVLWPAGGGEVAAGRTVRLDPEESHHLVRVRRAREGADVWAVIGDGRGARCTLLEADPEAAELRLLEIVEQWREPPLYLTLYLAPVRPAGQELALELGTELGLSAFTPVHTQRVERRSVRRDRLERIARETAKQCGRGLVPKIGAELTWADFLAEAGGEGLLIADEAGATGPREAARMLQARGVTAIGLLVGPEGGLAPDELAEAVAAGGIPVHLGTRRLRSEAAAVAALSLILCEYR